MRRVCPFSWSLPWGTDGKGVRLLLSTCIELTRLRIPTMSDWKVTGTILSLEISGWEPLLDTAVLEGVPHLPPQVHGPGPRTFRPAVFIYLMLLAWALTITEGQAGEMTIIIDGPRALLPSCV